MRQNKGMGMFKRESIELLRDRIDLVDLLSSYVPLKKSGSFFKGLCPFHAEKTPSFIVQPGDNHYHCFGCGAHGDAIEFLMSFKKLGFVDAIEYLADKYGVSLEEERSSYKDRGPNIKEVLDKAKDFFHFMLLYTEEGKEALLYLYERGIGLDFIKKFSIGYAPRVPFLFQNFMRKEGFEDNSLNASGLIKVVNEKKMDFFTDRIMIPVKDKLSRVIGFSSRKFKENTFGPKYINTPETALFKKSKILFGLSYSFKKIAKEERAIIVEGQFDALRLIHEGISIAVAGQGTAFGEDHMKELVKLGVKKVYLALDSDKAGVEASIKIGDMFQRKSVEVFVVSMGKYKDPDTFIMKKGYKEFIHLLKEARDYLRFLVEVTSKDVDLSSPALKNEWIKTLTDRINEWDQPILIHESMKRLAILTGVPENTLQHRSIYTQRRALLKEKINPDRIVEIDFLRWLFLVGDTGPRFFEIAKLNIKEEDFKEDICRSYYKKYLEIFSKEKKIDFFLLAQSMPEDDGVITEMMKKKINREKAEEGFLRSLKRFLERNWIEKREKIQLQIQNAKDDDTALPLAKEFDEIKNKRPEIVFP